jgi:hypothetical protein
LDSLRWRKSQASSAPSLEYYKSSAAKVWRKRLGLVSRFLMKIERY